MSGSSTQPRRGPRALGSMIANAVLLLAASACAAQGTSSLQVTAAESGRPANPGATGTLAAGASGEAARPSLPAGFPVLPGAVSLPPPADDPSVIARWTLPTEGSGPYEALLAALPGAGLPIVGAYPADQAALIRFTVAPGVIWQVILEHRDGGTLVTVQTDRP